VWAKCRVFTVKGGGTYINHCALRGLINIRSPENQGDVCDEFIIQLMQNVVMGYFPKGRFSQR
jgi:hypothetical protein